MPESNHRLLFIWMPRYQFGLQSLHDSVVFTHKKNRSLTKYIYIYICISILSYITFYQPITISILKFQKKYLTLNKFTVNPIIKIYFKLFFCYIKNILK